MSAESRHGVTLPLAARHVPAWAILERVIGFVIVISSLGSSLTDHITIRHTSQYSSQSLDLLRFTLPKMLKPAREPEVIQR